MKVRSIGGVRCQPLCVAMFHDTAYAAEQKNVLQNVHLSVIGPKHHPYRC